MKTLNQIKEKAKSLGLPPDDKYPLRGNKDRQIRQMIRWFQTSIDWAILAGKTIDPLDKHRVEEFNKFIE